MRAVAVAGLLAMTLTGCDLIHPPAQQTAAAAPCNCIQAPPEHLTRLAPPATVYHRHHYRGYARSSHSYREYASAEMAQYEYSSSSSDEQRGYYQHYEDQADDYRVHERGESWTDGYGRTHYGSATRVVSEDRKRLDPWHDYDKHCPERE